MNHAETHADTAAHSSDPAEAMAGNIPVVLPIVGAAQIFLLAFIAVFMA